MTARSSRKHHHTEAPPLHCYPVICVHRLSYHPVIILSEAEFKPPFLFCLSLLLLQSMLFATLPFRQPTATSVMAPSKAPIGDLRLVAIHRAPSLHTV